MKNTLIILLIVISNLTYAQSMMEIDSVANNMCEYLMKLDVEDDTLKMNTFFKNQLYSFMSKIEPSKAERVGKQVYYRLQRNCFEFRSLLDRLNPPQEGVIIITEKPTPEISKKELKEFKKQKVFYYYEVAGDKTTVLMKNGNWTDSFTDDTFSKLTYKWINDNEFELVFVESNNETRAYFSAKGDKFIYQVIAKEDGHYILSLNIPGQKTFEKFKLHY